MRIITMLRRQYRSFLVTLRIFKRVLTFSLIKRNYKRFPVLRELVRYTGRLDMLGTYKNGLNSQEPLSKLRDMTRTASKANMTRKEKAMLFLANKLTKQKQMQRETRVYRDKETKKVTVVNLVKEVK